LPSKVNKSQAKIVLAKRWKKSAFITWLKHYYSQQQISCELGKSQQEKGNAFAHFWEICNRVAVIVTVFCFFFCVQSKSFVRRLSQPAAFFLLRSREQYGIVYF